MRQTCQVCGKPKKPTAEQLYAYRRLVLSVAGQSDLAIRKAIAEHADTIAAVCDNVLEFVEDLRKLPVFIALGKALEKHLDERSEETAAAVIRELSAIGGK
jgi:hypothetical protein